MREGDKASAVPETKHTRSRAFCTVATEGLELGVDEEITAILT